MSQKEEILEITNLKEMLNKTKVVFKNKPAYKLKQPNGKYKTITHREVREMIDCLGTALTTLGLQGKRIGVIGENTKYT